MKAILTGLQPGESQSLTVLYTAGQNCKFANFPRDKTKTSDESRDKRTKSLRISGFIFTENSTFNQWNSAVGKVQMSRPYGRSPQTLEPPHWTEPWLQSELQGRQPRSQNSNLSALAH